MNYQEITFKSLEEGFIPHPRLEQTFLVGFPKLDKFGPNIDSFLEFDDDTREGTLTSIEPVMKANMNMRERVGNENPVNEFNLSFFERLVKERIKEEINASATIIQRVIRDRKSLIRQKQNFLVQVFKNKLSISTTKIQTNFRRFLVRRNYSNIIHTLPKNFYLLPGDFACDEIGQPSSLKLIIYRSLDDKEIMTYHDFFFSQTLQRFFLFLKRHIFEGTPQLMVNFVADGSIFNNEKYRAIYNAKESFYNVVNLLDLDSKPRGGRFTSLTSLPSRILRSNYFSPKIKATRTFLFKRKSERRVTYCPENFSNEVLRMTRSTSILKKSSRSVVHSAKNSKKMVTFSELVYETR